MLVFGSLPEKKVKKPLTMEYLNDILVHNKNNFHIFLTKGGKNVNKAELIEAVSKSTCTKAEATEAVNAVFDNITKALKKGDNVTLVGFGTFVVKKRKARIGRNPQTGKEIKIAAKKVPAFKPGKELKESVK